MSKNPLVEPLKPSISLLAKLGSIVVHADEMLSPEGHGFDRVALERLLKDADVQDWCEQMTAMALLPLKRNAKAKKQRSHP